MCPKYVPLVWVHSCISVMRPCALADPLRGSHGPTWSNRERLVAPDDSLGFVQPPWGLSLWSDAFGDSLMLTVVDGAHPLQCKPQELITLCQSYHGCKVVIIHYELCLAHPLHITPLSAMLEAAQHRGKSWAQLKQTNEPWRQELPATKDFRYKLSLSKHLKNVTRLHKHCCSVSTPVACRRESKPFPVSRVMPWEPL